MFDVVMQEKRARVSERSTQRKKGKDLREKKSEIERERRARSSETRSAATLHVGYEREEVDFGNENCVGMLLEMYCLRFRFRTRQGAAASSMVNILLR